MMRKQFGFFLQLAIILFTGMGLILTVSGNSHAENFDGGYLGASAGMARYSAEIEGDGDSLDGISADGASFGFMAGYGSIISGNKYFGIEGNIGGNTAEFESSYAGEKIEIEPDETYGFSARLGFMSGNWMTYGLVGWQMVKVDAQYSGSLGQYSGDEDFNGLRLGFGTEYQSTEQLFLRGEYSYTMYGEEEAIEPSAGIFQLSIGYRFNY